MFRIKEIKNKVTGDIVYKVQVKFLWWWNTCKIEWWEHGRAAIFNHYSQAFEYKRKREFESGW